MKSASSTSTSPPTLSFHEIANLVVIVLLSILSVGNADEDATKALAPFIKPPSEEFCSVNQLGDQIYPISVFQACTFKFYVTPLPPSFNTSGSTHDSDDSLFSCDDVLDDDNDMSLISTQYRQVVGWPDVCVANGPRCYSILDNPSLVNYTMYSDAMVDGLSNITGSDDDTIESFDLSQYRMEFPKGARVVSVNCSNDFTQAQQFAKDLPAIAGEVGEGLTIFAIALLISVLLCVCTVCACLVSCCYSGVNSRSQYKEVPSVDHDFPPVKGKKFEEGTSIKV